MSYSLPTGSSALAALDAFCLEWGGLSRTEGTQRLVIAWAKARHGEFSAIGAMGLALPVVTPVPLAPVLASRESAEARGPVRGKRSPTSNAQAVELDL